MKRFYLFMIAVFAATAADAKGIGAMVTMGPPISGPFPHFAPQVTGGGIPGSPKVSLRLIGRTQTRFNGSVFVPIDSFSYEYWGDLGGVLNNEKIDNDETINFDVSYRYVFNDTTNAYQNRLRRSQTYNADGSISILTYAPWLASANDWKDSSRFLYAYSNGKMAKSTFQLYYANMWTQDMESTLIYNGQNITAMESVGYKVSFSYDASNNLIGMSDEEYTSGSWHNKEKHDYAYNGKDLILHTLWQWNEQSQSWVYSKQWEYGYTGIDLTSITEKHWNGSWDNYGKHVYTYDGAHNKLTNIWQLWSWSNFNNVTKEEWQYNSQSLPEKITNSTWNGSSWYYANGDKQYRFYYQNYFPSYVDDGNLAGNIHTYPVPATDFLNVDLNWDKPENFKIVFYDARGTVLRTWNESATGNYHNSIPVAEFPSGIYFVSVKSENTQYTDRVVINH